MGLKAIFLGTYNLLRSVNPFFNKSVGIFTLNKLFSPCAMSFIRGLKNDARFPQYSFLKLTNCISFHFNALKSST